MMYTMSMLRHRFSNERWGGGGGGALNYLPLLFRKIKCAIPAKNRTKYSYGFLDFLNSFL